GSGVVATNNFLKAGQHTGCATSARSKDGKMVRGSGPTPTQPQNTVPASLAVQPGFTGIGDQVVNYLTPGDYATIYNSTKLVASGNDGTGTSIASVGRSDIALSAVEAFRRTSTL